MFKNIDTEAACRMLYELPVFHTSETVALSESLYRIVSDTVRARLPVPPFDKSPYDGYAFRGGDTSAATRGEPARLKVIEEVPAGTQPRYKITPGEAAKILTGAPIPAGADATVKYELTEFTNTEVRFFEPIEPYTGIIYAGSVISPGDMLAREGTLITPPVIAMLADQGVAAVNVFKKPVVTVICTGSELSEIGEPLRPASIYNSNVHTLSAYLTQIGAAPRNGGVVSDVPEFIARRIEEALWDSDMVITTGGASVGDYDLALKSMQFLNMNILFWKASMKPGGAILAAVAGNKLVLGLSGNPGAAVLGFLRIAMPYMKKLCGRFDCFYPEVSVALREPLLKSSPKLRILRGRLEIEDAKAYFAEGKHQGSEATSSLIGCDLLGEIPMGSPPLPAGTIIKAYRLTL